jgi:hypothetical protein
MTESHEITAEPPANLRSSYVPVKEGHPRFNLAVLVVLVAAFLVFALIEAQRLQF